MSDDSFLNRWSRKKLTEPVVEEVAAVSQEPEAEPEEDKPDAVLLEEAGLPDPDEASEDADFSAYLKAKLPERIKERAMRRLWRSNPVLANLDGLCDYNDDFTDAALVVDDLKTVYQVGKGMVTAFLEPDEEDDAEDAAEDEIAPLAEAEDQERSEEVVAVEPAEFAEKTPIPDLADADMPDAQPRLRHMQFRKPGTAA